MDGLNDVVKYIEERDGPVATFKERFVISPTTDVPPVIEEKSTLKKLLPKSLYREQNKQSWINDPTIQSIIKDDPIIDKIIQTESQYDPNARSRKHAVGLMQIMEDTAIDPGFGVTPMSPEDRLDPVKNVQFGAEYFNALKNKFGGDEKLALMSFNWGYGNVRKWIAAGSDPSQIPSETVEYLEKILGTETLMEEPMGMASLDIEDEITLSNKGGRIERDPYNNYNKQRII